MLNRLFFIFSEIDKRLNNIQHRLDDIEKQMRNVKVVEKEVQKIVYCSDDDGGLWKGPCGWD